MSVANTCIGGSADYKKIEETTDKHLYNQMHQRLQTRYARTMKKRRQATVEPVLGTLINFMGIQRIWTRGLQRANKFMIAAAIAYNLKNWINYKDQNPKTRAMALKKTGNGYFINYVTLWRILKLHTTQRHMNLN